LRRTVITGNLELLQGVLETDPQVPVERQFRLIGAALRAAEHGAKMTQQLLAFARRGVLQSRVIDLNAVIIGMLEFLQRTLGDAITLEFAPAHGLWSCQLDPVQFEAAILNLAINARDAMPEGGRLRIELSNIPRRRGSNGDPKSFVCVRVVDSGIGMSEAVVERAFEPFFTTKNIGEGSGLGLSQVHGFVSQSGGEVEIDSTPGAGTTVVLYLPRSGAPAGKEGDAAAVDASREGGGETILVVEDEEPVRDIAVEMLEDLGYRVLTAHDGVAALTLLRGRAPVDLLFSDVLMPGGISGVALASRARQLRPGLGVLLTSGYPAEDGATVGRGNFPLLQKPYRRDKLGMMLRAALDVRASRPSLSSR
jgi:CheY-like chemotaxis protein